MSVWTQKYVGIPWADLGRDWTGIDCWGLPCLVYREELSIELPPYVDYPTTAERNEVAAIVAGATSSPFWRQVDRPRVFDICLFKMHGLVSHVGIHTAEGRMIHVAEGLGVVSDTYAKGRWKTRFAGHYRLASMLEGAHD